MKRFGLIGHPIAHSLSPALFKAAYDGKYAYDLIEEDNFEKAYSRFLNEYDGINVTAPFKELALAKADILTDDCIAAGATNLLIKTPEGVTAYNSDFSGVRKWLAEVSEKLECSRARVLIAGYGGAGKAAAAAARSLGMDVSIVNRTIRDDNMKPLSEFCNEFRKADIIIYNIPSLIDEVARLYEKCDNEDASGVKIILEANYRNPSFTPELQKRIRKAYPGAQFVDGKLWLLYQAVTGYEIFTGETPDLEKMSDVL
jgi:shikimate 5-dehydrogenase